MTYSIGREHRIKRVVVEDGTEVMGLCTDGGALQPIPLVDLDAAFVAQPKAGKLCDWQIRQRCEARDIITPFVPHQVRYVDSTGEPINGSMIPADAKKIVSYGLSSYGYDIRLSRKFRVYRPAYKAVIDPHDFNEDKVLEEYEGDYCDIPANGYILANTLERFDIPSNMVCDAIGKSTYARCGLVVISPP